MVRPTRRQLIRALLLVAVCALTALVMVPVVRFPDADLPVGAVAPRNISAPTTFAFEDVQATLDRQQEAAEAVVSVYDFDGGLGPRLQGRVSDAFDVVRRGLATAPKSEEPETLGEVSPELVRQFQAQLQERLGVRLADEELEGLFDEGLSPALEAMTNQLLGTQQRRYLVADRSLLPVSAPIRVIRLRESREEVQLDDFSSVHTLDEARRSLSLEVLDRFEDGPAGQRLRLAASIAKVMLQPNFARNQLLTEERRLEAMSSVAPVQLRISEGTTIVRKGDVVDEHTARVLGALEDTRGDDNMLAALGALFAFSLLLYGAVYSFAGLYIRKFSTRTRDLAALGFLMILTLAFARGLTEIAVPLAQASPELESGSFFYMLPLAGVALLVRILINSETSLVFSVVAAALVAFLMGQQVHYAAFFVVSSVTAAGSIGKDRERKGILRAGIYTGLMSAAFVLLLDLVRMYLPEAAVGGGPIRPVWDAVFAFTGGLLSAFLVLGLVPFFELFGFVTDLRLLELANLDHPQLRNLMLKAPGTYHHSIMVGTLAEAGAESIGCNALVCRVTSYFHDIGKAIKPQYFAENQGRGMPNIHEKLTPRMSAQLIIDHVREGAAIARSQGLPKPIVDAILTHHGTGLLKSFWVRAQETDPDISESEFRYPGPKPSTREMGVIMLADKTEAACRTLRQPTAENIAAMIQKIVNSTLQDGQFDECPLTVAEIVTIADAFQGVLAGVYHHRVDYAETRAISTAGTGDEREKPSREAVITLEIRPGEVDLDPSSDYESVQNLPGIGGSDDG